MKQEIDQFPITFEDFDIPLLVTDSTSKQKISKIEVDMNSTINQFILSDSCRIFHPKTAGYILIKYVNNRSNRL